MLTLVSAARTSLDQHALLRPTAAGLTQPVAMAVVMTGVALIATIGIQVGGRVLRPIGA
ncbi:hypothetical protein [Corynebacterium occultum]|uniref:hypothetical protein n=1 Tax=Corynebacterium occultum TaxID=2675219 RepID=UPI0012E2A234|nr:hypothetical protein [Corynebacterium occultum]